MHIISDIAKRDLLMSILFIKDLILKLDRIADVVLRTDLDERDEREVEEWRL